MSTLAPDPYERVVQLETELGNIHRVHIDDIRALLAQFEVEKASWTQKLQEAVGRECGALCGDIEQDRDGLAREIQQLREEGVPGVMHQIDRLRFQVVEGDRDRYANLHSNLARRQRNLVGEFRAARHASRSVRLVEGLLADALGREPGSINGDNVEEAFTELVKERDHFREQWGMWAGKDSDINLNEQVVVALRQKLSAAVGTDLPRDRLVEMLDHLVKTYRGQAAEIEVLEARCRDKAAEIRILEGTDGLHAVAIAAQLTEAQGRIAHLAEDANRREDEMAQARANWAADMATLRKRYAGLESASRAVGQQLTQALGWCDQMRARRVADADLLRDAYELIHGIGEGAMPNWVRSSRAWVARFNTHEEVTATDSDPLAGFDVRGVSDGRHVKVYVEHSRSSCVRGMAWEMPQGETPLTDVLASAYHHLAREHAAHAPEPQDEASPGDEGDLCGDTCYNSHGVHCPDRGNVPTEVNE